MPAHGEIKIENKGKEPASDLHITYSGHIDVVTCEEFKNACYGDGAINLSNGSVAPGATATLIWKDNQGQTGPTWKTFRWSYSAATFKIRFGKKVKAIEHWVGQLSTDDFETDE